MNMNYMALPGIKECDRDIQTDPFKRAENIIHKVCRYFGVNDLAVRSKCRSEELCTARKWCFYFIKMKTQLTLKSIAKILGDRDHTTCMYNIKYIKEQLTSKAENVFKGDYEQLIQII